MASISRSWIDVVGRSPLGLDLDALEAIHEAERGGSISLADLRAHLGR